MELGIGDLKPFLPGLEDVLNDGEGSEVMVNGPGAAFVERRGRMAAISVPALTADAVARAAVQIAGRSAGTRTPSRSSTPGLPTAPASPSAAPRPRRPPRSPSGASAAGRSPSTS